MTQLIDRTFSGADGYLSDPGYMNNNNKNNDSEFHSADNTSKPYHYIHGKTVRCNTTLVINIILAIKLATLT